MVQAARSIERFLASACVDLCGILAGLFGWRRIRPEIYEFSTTFARAEGRKTRQGEEGEQDEIHLPGVRTEWRGEAVRAVSLRRVLGGYPRSRSSPHASRSTKARAARMLPRFSTCAAPPCTGGFHLSDDLARVRAAKGCGHGRPKYISARAPGRRTAADTFTRRRGTDQGSLAHSGPTSILARDFQGKIGHFFARNAVDGA